jgi:hypothetical protein
MSPFSCIAAILQDNFFARKMDVLRLIVFEPVCGGDAPGCRDYNHRDIFLFAGTKKATNICFGNGGGTIYQNTPQLKK